MRSLAFAMMLASLSTPTTRPEGGNETSYQHRNATEAGAHVENTLTLTNSSLAQQTFGDRIEDCRLPNQTLMLCIRASEYVGSGRSPRWHHCPPSYPTKVLWVGGRVGLGRILLRLILVRRWPIDTLARNDIDEHAVLRGSKRARADQVPDLVGIVRRNV